MRSTLILALAIAAGCSGNVLARRPPSGPMAPGDDRGTPVTSTTPGTPETTTTRPASPPTMTAPGDDFTRKKVSAKEEPNVLIAVDRTRCIVTEARFRETALGESVACAWTK